MSYTEEQYQALLRRQKKPGAPVPKTEPARRKYGNRPTVVDGQQFDSIREAERYKELQLLERAGKIRNLRIQVRYPIVVGGIEICLYVSDFDFDDDHGLHHVEDVKSQATKTAVYRLKKKLMAACHGITIQEILR